MRALSIRNPWAELIARGIKDVENRNWYTNIRGTVLIHATKTPDKRHRALNRLFTAEQWNSLSRYNQLNMSHGTWLNSAILGTIDIVDCVNNSKSIWAEPMSWHWILDNPVLFSKPITNVKGKLSFWNYPNINRNSLQSDIKQYL